MTDVVNLNQFRKKRRREEKNRTAEFNRAQFGRTKAEREAALSAENAANKDLDGKKKSPDGETEDTPKPAE